MTPPQSQTPETDANEKEVAKAINAEGFCESDFARSLEKRLNEALAKLRDESRFLHEKNITANTFMNQVKRLHEERTHLLAQIAVKDAALKEIITLETNSPWHGTIFTTIASRVLTNSPAAAQEMVERMERMEKAFDEIRNKLDNHPYCGSGYPHEYERGYNQAVKSFKALSTTKKPADALAELIITPKPEGGI